MERPSHVLLKNIDTHEFVVWELWKYNIYCNRYRDVGREAPFIEIAMLNKHTKRLIEPKDLFWGDSRKEKH